MNDSSGRSSERGDAENAEARNGQVGRRTSFRTSQRNARHQPCWRDRRWRCRARKAWSAAPRFATTRHREGTRPFSKPAATKLVGNNGRSFRPSRRDARTQCRLIRRAPLPKAHRDSGAHTAKYVKASAGNPGIGKTIVSPRPGTEGRLQAPRSPCERFLGSALAGGAKPSRGDRARNGTAPGTRLPPGAPPEDTTVSRGRPSSRERTGISGLRRIPVAEAGRRSCDRSPPCTDRRCGSRSFGGSPA